MGLKQKKGDIDWDKIFTPIILAKLTIVRDKMTGGEYNVAHEITNNWIKFIKNNFIPKNKND